MNGAKLKEMREALGWSQPVMAHVIGQTEAWVDYYEISERDLPPKDRDKLMARYKQWLDQYFGETLPEKKRREFKHVYDFKVYQSIREQQKIRDVLRKQRHANAPAVLPDS